MNENDFLGYVIWYSLPSDLLVNLSDLERVREELDPLIRLPKKPSKLNLFKRACKEVKWKDNGVKYFFGQELKSSIGPYRYFYEKYKVDGIFVEDVKGTVTLEDDGNLLCLNLSENYSDSWEKACKMLKFKMQESDFVDHMAVRSVIKNVVENKMKAIWLNSGTYFVKSEHLNQLNVLQEIVRSLGCEFEILPLVDTQQQKDMLYKGYTNLINSIESLFAERVAELPEKPSAFKVEKLEKMISSVKDLQLDLKELGFNYATGEYMEYMLKMKLEGGPE